MATKPQVLVLGPGGFKNFTQLGALLCLEKAHYLDNVTTFAGVGVGAVISLLLATGYKAETLIDQATRNELFQELSHINFAQLSNQSGLISNEALKVHLQHLIREKLGLVPTMGQFYQATGNHYMAVTYNLTQSRTEYITKEVWMNLSCIDAAMLSVQIPFLFYRLLHQNCYYIDGSFGDPYPVKMFDDGKTCVLGIYTETEGTCEAMVSYCYKVLSAPIDQLKRQIQKTCSSRCLHLTLKSGFTDSLTPSDQQKSEMVASGFQAAQDFLKPVNSVEVITLGSDSPRSRPEGS